MPRRSALDVLAVFTTPWFALLPPGGLVPRKPHPSKSGAISLLDHSLLKLECIQMRTQPKNEMFLSLGRLEEIWMEVDLFIRQTVLLALNNLITRMIRKRCNMYELSISFDIELLDRTGNKILLQFLVRLFVVPQVFCPSDFPLFRLLGEREVYSLEHLFVSISNNYHICVRLCQTSFQIFFIEFFERSYERFIRFS